jgi:hypothetical protein
MNEHISLFEPKRLSDFSKSVRNVFNLMTISRKYKVIGSAGLKSIRYNADYDLNEIFKESGLISTDKMLDKILHLFQRKFVEAEADPNYYIIDFKCGMNENGNPLRWNKLDIANGYKILQSGRKIHFQECILMKTTMKLDVIALIDGVFTEFSDNYYIKLGPDKANFFPHDIEREHILNSLKHSYDEYMYAQLNYFKGLKRCFSYYLMDGEDKHLGKLKSLLAFFNSVTGLLYKLTSEIDTIILLMNNNFRKPPIDDLKKNIQIIHDGIPDINADGAKQILMLAKKSKTAGQMQNYLETSKRILKDIIDKRTLDYISKNKNVLLY